jgi:uncharacterized protein YlxP (DUF503 family)
VRAAVVAYDLHIPDARSLKAKRAAIKPIIEGARHRFSVSVAEVDHQDQWQRSVIAVAAVASSGGHLDDILDSIDRFVWSHPGIEILSTERSWLDGEA